MAITVDRIFEEALCLTSESRMALAERLLESIEPDRSILDAQSAVAAQRADDLETGQVHGIPGTEALKRVREAVLKRSQA